MPIKIPTASIGREKYIHYWRNAQECFVGMQDAAVQERWHLTALSGIHCVIAAADTLLVFTAGLRSKSKNHRDVFTLISQHVDDPESSRMLRHGLNVVVQKTEVEYSAKRITQAQAYQLMRQVERFYEWVRSKVEQ